MFIYHSQAEIEEVFGKPQNLETQAESRKGTQVFTWVTLISVLVAVSAVGFLLSSLF